jgi:NADPH-dependent 2,4-dienoyl-CoA reductase/sulfur reductase-like enzyme
MQAKYVLIGNSAASLAAVEWIRRHDPSGSILLVNRETGPAYSRVALPYYVAGEMSLDDLLIRRDGDYARLGVERLEGQSVTGLDPAARTITLEDGRAIGFEKLFIGTGSVCARPPIRGLEQMPHHYLWTLEDAIGMKAAAERARTAVVIGGGFIGMLAAEALRKLGLRLTIVEMADQLLPQLLDAEGGRRFLRAVNDEGTTVRLGAEVEAVEGPADGIRVHLKGGDTLTADLLAVAAGVRPNLAFAAGGVLAADRGLLVDEFLETSAPGVYAAGDVAEVKDFLSDGRAVHAIWPTAVEQGRIAGANMAGKRIPYPGSLGMNVVELFRVTLAQLGRFREGPGDQVRLLGGDDAANYRKIVVDRDGILVGGMYLGDGNGVAEMGVLHGLIKRRSTWAAFASHRLPGFTYATTVHAVPRA